MNTETLNPTTDDFASMFEQSAAAESMVEGKVVPATIISVDSDFVVVDVGLKTEGRIATREFALEDTPPEVGSIIEVYLDRIENAKGDAVLSRDKARREESWIKLEDKYNAGETVNGILSGKVKGGFTVDLGGVSAFLPGSQVDIRPVRDITPLMGEKQPFAILKMDRPRGNVVVSRRAVLEESRAEQRAEIVGNMAEGDERDGIVKNITDYGAFVDLGGIDGLLHVTDMTWKRINHPSQVVEVGQTVKVKIVKINNDTQRISLGMKQLDDDPWTKVEENFPIGTRLTGEVTNITDYGAFVELKDGVEGLIHVSEMSWTKKNVHPGKILSSSQQVDVEVLEIDLEKRRISLGLKQTMDNPWTSFMANYPVGTEVEGEIRGITEFGLFVAVGEDLDGMVHMNDISWDQSGEEAITAYSEGDTVRVKVIDIDIDKERIALGIKQLAKDPMGRDSGMSRGSIVTCVVTEITTGGIEVEFGDPAGKAFIRRSDLSRDRGEQRPERFSVGDKIDAKIMQLDRQSRKVSLSIKALQLAEEKEAVAQYGSADSGASLGDILGAALAGSGGETADQAPASKPKKAAAKADAADAAAVALPTLDGPDGDADDFTTLKGVGPKLAGQLNEMGFYHFWQITKLSDDEAQALDGQVGGRLLRDDWKTQISEL